MKYRSIIIAVTCLLSAGTQAQTLSPEQAINKIVSNNPQLKAVEEECKTQMIAGKATSAPELAPELDYTHTFGREGAKIDAGVSLDFDWLNLYKKNKTYAELVNMTGAMKYMAELKDVKQQAMRLITDGAYAEIRLAELNKILATLQQARDAIKRGFDGGTLTIIDVRKAELEVVKIELAIAEVENELEDVRTQLCTLANNDDLQVDMLHYMPLELPELDYCISAAEMQPDVMVSRAQAGEQGALAKIERAKSLPGFSVGYVYQRELRENFNGFSVGLRLPVRSKLYAQAADAEAQRYESSATLLADTHKINAMRTHERATWLREKLDVLSAAALGNNYVELVEKAWRGGQINVITYLQEVGYYLDTRMSVLDLEHEYRLALVELARYTH